MLEKTLENKLMIGGFDEIGDTIKDKDVSNHDKDLVKSANSMLLDKYDIDVEYSYTAIFEESKDMLPYMGIDPNNEDIFVVWGVGGNGTVYSKIGSTIVGKWIKQDSLDEYQIFRLRR